MQEADVASNGKGIDVRGEMSCSKYSGRRESKKRRPTVLPAQSVVHLRRHDHGLELLKVLRISTPTPRGQEAQLD
jgi:hypothetical protein